MSVVAYTAIFGGRDEYVPLSHEPSVLYTDRMPEDPGRSSVILLPCLPRGPRYTSRRFKTAPHDLPELAEHGVYVWMDGRIAASHADLSGLASRFLDSADIAVFRNPTKDCAYPDLEAAASGDGTGDPAVARAQMERYRAEGFPSHAGYAATGILLRRRTRLVEEFGRLWLSEIDRGSVRDQYSFTYVAWKLGACVRYLEWPPEAWGFEMRSHARVLGPDGV